MRFSQIKQILAMVIVITLFLITNPDQIPKKFVIPIVIFILTIFGLGYLSGILYKKLS